MDTNEELGRRLLELHGIANSSSGPQEAPVDMRRAEFQHLVDVLLGRDYDSGKVDRAATIQASMSEAHSKFLEEYERGELSADEYVQQFNTEAIRAYREIELELGTNDFNKLFGGPPEQNGGLIDKEMFLESELEDSKEKASRLKSDVCEADLRVLHSENLFQSADAVLVALNDETNAVDLFAKVIAEHFCRIKIQKVSKQEVSAERLFGLIKGEAATLEKKDRGKRDVKVLYCSCPSSFDLEIKHSTSQKSHRSKKTAAQKHSEFGEIVRAFQAFDEKRHVFALRSHYRGKTGDRIDANIVRNQCFVIVSIGAKDKTPVDVYKQWFQKSAMFSILQNEAHSATPVCIREWDYQGPE